MDCPVCGGELAGVLCCDRCGFDLSLHCERFPTLAVFPSARPSAPMGSAVSSAMALLPPIRMP